jgi:hypothetical protein
MAQNYEVSFSTDNSSFTALDYVQNISMTNGRERQLNAYNASRASVTLRYPSGFASPITQIVSGTFIKIIDVGNTITMFNGIIDNVDVQYGIPFVGSIGNADFLTFTVEGAFALFGRMSGEDYVMPAGDLTTQLALCVDETDLTTTFTGTDQTIGGTTISGTWGEWLNKLMTTLNFRMHDSRNAKIVDLKSPFVFRTAAVNFSDTTNNATNQVYDQINFGSYADNFYTQVIIDPENFAASTVETGSEPFRTLKINTFNASTGQATDYANYLLGNYDTQSFALLSISCLAEAQNNFKLNDLGLTIDKFPTFPGVLVNVTFRGTVFNCVIEGVTMTATPESSRYTYHLSGADLNAYLILDNAVFGKLNENKLGY